MKYKLEDKQLPLMLETDGIARYYGLEKGKVVKVTYRGGVVGSLKTYRCVDVIGEKKSTTAGSPVFLRWFFFRTYYGWLDQNHLNPAVEKPVDVD
ncbi:hypothetical protein ACE6H2_006257 [Prunus campanulata]